MARVTIIGAGGMLGAAMVYTLRQLGFHVQAYDRARFDVLTDNPADLPMRYGDYIVNCSGMINRREGVANAEAVFLQVNSLFPHRMADAADAVGARFIHITTDCAFDGQAGLYYEDAPRNAQDLYGRSKALGEPANCLTLRTSIIGPERRNFYSLVCWVLAQDGPVNGYMNHQWNGVTTLELSRVIAKVVSDNLWERGLFHLYGEDVTKFDLIQRIARAWGKTLEVKPYCTPADRDHRLRTRRPDKLAAFAVRSLDEQLAAAAAASDGMGRWKPHPAFDGL